MKPGLYLKDSHFCHCGARFHLIAPLTTFLRRKPLFSLANADFELDIATHELDHLNKELSIEQTV